MRTPSVISVTLHEWQRTRLADKTGRPIPVSFTPADLRLAEKLSQGGFLELRDLRSGLEIQTKSYVGRLSIGPLDLHIQPKIDRLPLLSILRYAFDLNKLQLFEVTTKPTGDSGFLELLVVQLLAEAKVLLSRGLAKRYLDQQRYLTQPRGRLDLPRLARDGFRQDSRLPCNLHPRLLDIPHNQCLRACLRLASRMTSDKQLAFQCRQVSALLEEGVSPCALSQTLFDEVARNHGRMLRHYEPAITIGKLLAQLHGILLDSSDGEQTIPGYLFDMNRLYQCALGRFLRENLPGLEVLEEHSLKGMFVYQQDFNPKHRTAPVPRPDFLVRKQTRVLSVLDAKYRDLWEETLPREMLYQLGMYALAHPQVMGATILYPTMDPNARESRIAIQEPLSGKWQSEVRLRPVILPHWVRHIEAQETPQDRRERYHFARHLAFGDDLSSETRFPTPRTPLFQSGPH